MEVELHKIDFKNLVKSQVPNYNIMERYLKYGKYLGGFHDKWIWYDSELDKLTEEELFGIYNACVHSWL